LEEARIWALEALLLAEARVSGLYRVSQNSRKPLEPPLAAPRPAEVRPYSLVAQEPWLAQAAKKPPCSPLRRLTAVTVGVLGALFLGWVLSRGASGPPEPQIYVYNGLGSGINLFFSSEQGQRALYLSPGQTVRPEWIAPGEAYALRTESLTFGPVESLSLLAPRDNRRKLVYSPAGAAPMAEWLAYYGEDGESPSLERKLGAPRLAVSQADIVLSPPPPSLKIKGPKESRLVLSALSRSHPDLVLELLPQESLKARLIETQARFSDPEDIWTPSWLELLAGLDEGGSGQDGGKALSILRQRTQALPQDIYTARALISIAPPEEREALCRKFSGLSLESPERYGPAYLSALCLEGPERDAALEALWRKFPGEALTSREMGKAALSVRGDLGGARVSYAQAFELDPRSLGYEVESLARLMRLSGLSNRKIKETYGPYSPKIDRLSSLEDGQMGGDGAFSQEVRLKPYALLARGLLEDALSQAEPGLRPFILRLAGASEGAGPEITQEALALAPSQGLSEDTAWAALGLALREDAAYQEYRDFVLSRARGPEEREMAQAAIEILLKARARPSQGLPEEKAEQAEAADPAIRNEQAEEAALGHQEEPPEGQREAFQADSLAGERLEALSRGQDPRFLGQVCLGAYLALGETASGGCRYLAKGLLFISERPYMK
jgi:hypothetical protein